MRVLNGFKKIFLKQLLLLFMICVLLFIHLVEAGSNEYQGSSNKRLNIVISQEGVNRIAVERDRIAKVIGNAEEYSIEGDNTSGVIFISSRLIAGEVSPITIITEKGFTQDINLKVQKGKEAKSILIKKPVFKGSNPADKNNKNKRNVVKGVADVKQNAIEAIKDVSSGNTRDYSFRRIGIKSLSRSRESVAYSGYQGLIEKGIKVTKITEYTSRYLKIHKYEYKKKPAEIGLKEITKIFPRSLAVSERGNAIYVVYNQ